MRNRRTGWTWTPHRATALLLAFVCLWISGGVTLHHTDDLAPFLTFHAGRSVLSHAVPIGPPEGPCLAHQWENAAFDPQVPAIHAVSLPLALMPLPALILETHSPHPFDHTSPRAPPRYSA